MHGTICTLNLKLRLETQRMLRETGKISFVLIFLSLLPVLFWQIKAMLM